MHTKVRERLSRCRSAIRRKIKHLPHPLPPIVLFFSVSDTDARARVVTATGASLEAAWQKGLTALRAEMRAHGLAGRWIRIDWVESATASTWNECRSLLKKTKRNYFRRGIAIDPRFEVAFTEQELNANAMLYGGNKINHAVLNEKNFLLYSRIKFDGVNLPFDDDKQIFVFATRGVFSDECGAVYELNASGLDGGRRTIDKMVEEDLFQLVQSGSDFLARQVKSDGSFEYGYHPCFDRKIKTYNALRHASTTYSMIEAWEVTSDNSLKNAIDQALEYLCEVLIKEVKLPCGTDAAFVVDLKNEIKLGANGVAVLALTKYASTFKTEKYIPLANRLSNGIIYMQNPIDGSFIHVINYPDLTLKDSYRTIYYEGEATFGLLRLYDLTRADRLLKAAEKAFEIFIKKEHWRHHDHWLSYSVNELTRFRPEERYYKFGIQNFADHLDFVIQRITTFPTLLELMTAAETMLQRIEEQEDLLHLLATVDIQKFYKALHVRAHHLLNGHFWPELAMYYRKPSRIVGSFFIRHHAFRVRIDDVEHYLSGLIAYREYLRHQEIDEKIRAENF